MRGRLAVAALTGAFSPAHAGSRTGTLQQLQSSEPPTGGMRMNQVVFVDDHTCPAGQVEMAAPQVHNGPRRRSCVPR